MGKEMVVKELYGDDGVSYHQLVWYINALKQIDPGCYVVLEVDHTSHKFQRLFIAYGPCIARFNYYRPVVCLDGTFLKGKHKGTLLAATGLNGDQGLFPLAMAVVVGETESNWSWFLDHLKNILSSDKTLAFLSDRHIGLLKHVPRVFPNSDHGYYFWHLKKNLNYVISSRSSKNNVRGEILKLFKDCVITATHEEFNYHMADPIYLGGDEVRRFLSDISVEKWASAYFLGKRYGMLSSGIADSFNNWIREERFLPITCMVDKLRTKIMEMITNRREDCKRWDIILCPEFENKLIKKVEASRSMVVVKTIEFLFEAQASPHTHLVDLKFQKYSCRQWGVESFPCAHVVTSIMSNGEDVYSFIDPCFTVRAYSQTYSRGFPPMPNAGMSMVIEGDVVILPPDVRKQPGRPKTKRIGVDATKKPKRKITCSIRKATGHNMSTCKAKLG